MDNKIARESAEARLQKAIKDASTNVLGGASIYQQQKATENILNAKIEYNNTLSEIGDITREEALQRNAELKYQLRINNNNTIKMGNASTTTVMADLYDAQMEYLDNLKRIQAMRQGDTNNNTNNNTQNNNNADNVDWRVALIQEFLGINNSQNPQPENNQNKRSNAENTI